MEQCEGQPRIPPEVGGRAVRMVAEHRDDYPSEWAAVTSIAGKLGMTAETLRVWVRRPQIDGEDGPGLSIEERQRLKNSRRRSKSSAEQTPPLHQEAGHAYSRLTVSVLAVCQTSESNVAGTLRLRVLQCVDISTIPRCRRNGERSLCAVSMAVLVGRSPRIDG